MCAYQICLEIILIQIYCNKLVLIAIMPHVNKFYHWKPQNFHRTKLYFLRMNNNNKHHCVRLVVYTHY